jgi:hypothetical protein
MFTTTLFFYLQNYFLSIGYDPLSIGFFMALSSIASATSAFFAHKLESLMKKTFCRTKYNELLQHMGNSFFNSTLCVFYPYKYR